VRSGQRLREHRQRTQIANCHSSGHPCQCRLQVHDHRLTQEDLQRTGQQQTSKALDSADPTVQIHH
jgi:hypothetical protein